MSGQAHLTTFIYEYHIDYKKGGIKIKSDKTRKYFFIFFFIGFLVLAYFIISPFLTTIITSMLLAYIFYPVYKRVNKKIPSKNISSALVIILVIILILLPSYFVLNSLLGEAYLLYPTIKQKIFSGELIPDKCLEEDTGITCQISKYIQSLITNPTIKSYIDESIKKGANYLIENVSGFFISLPGKLLHFFITLFLLFFFFKDGEKFVKKIEDLLPLRKSHKKHVFQKFNESAFAVVYGTLIVAIIQGTLGGIGFFVVGIHNPVIWALAMMFFALIPFIGTPIIWLPAALFLIVQGYLSSDTWGIIKGIILLIYGTFVISFIDNILKPKIIGDHGGVHPILVLLGVLGGLQLMGFIGILVGPVLLTLFVAFLQVYEEEEFF